MNSLKITIIHQWWLNDADIQRLLFADNAELLTAQMYPFFTDCTESVYRIEAANTRSLVKELQAALDTIDDPVSPEISIDHAICKELDQRIVSIQIEVIRAV